MAAQKSCGSRKHLSGAGVIFLILIALMTCQIPMSTRAAQPGGFGGGIFDIVPDASTLSNLPAVGTSFYLQGKIYPFRTVNQATCTLPAGVDALGTWRAWGEVADNGRIVLHQSLEFDVLNGSIEVQGVSGITLANEDVSPAVSGTTGSPFTGPSEALSVTGGAGTFRGIQGEAQIRPYCQTQTDTLRAFRYDRAFCLGIVEAKRR